MTTAKCKTKHTPIVSEAQRRLFGARAGGKKTKAKGLTIIEAKKHIKEVAGKSLPERVRGRGKARAQTEMKKSWRKKKT